jgi:hypothetical protein
VRRASLAVLAALALGVPALASAQGSGSPARRGLWGGFGFGTGVNLTDTYVADGASGGSLWGFGGYGRIGGTLNQQVLLGGETYGWVGSRDGVDFARGNISAVILFYPSPQGGFFLKGGVGFGYIATAIYASTTVGGVNYQNSVTQGKSGFGATAGVGFDVRLGRNIYLVPAVDWYLQSVGSQSSLVFGETPGTNNQIAFSLGLVWH